MQGTADTLESGVESNVDRELLRAHLDHIIGSPQFAAAPRLAKFLSFVVETVLDGKGDQIKESMIAIEVYGRRPDYNPQIDSTVRVEAGRLRARLRQYYETVGRDQALEIELPKGRYVPVFHRRQENTDAVERLPPEGGQPRYDRPLVTMPGIDTIGQIRARTRTFVLAGMISAAALTAGLIYYDHGITIARGASGTPIHPPAVVPDPKTMESYLRAYELLRLPVLKEGVVASVPPTVFESVRLFEEVVRSYPRFAKGWTGLAEANEWLFELDKNRPPERLIAAKSAALRAVDLDPNLPEAWTILTSILFFREWDIPAAEAAARRAVELNPRDTLAHKRYVDLLRIQGRVDEATREVVRAASIQPSAPSLRNRKALLLLESGDWEGAIAEAKAAEALNTSKQQMAYTLSLWIQAAAHQHQGRLDRAEAIYRQAIDHQPHDPWSEPSLGYLFATTGRQALAREILAELRRQLALGRPRQKAIALIYMGLGEYNEAMTWLERGFIERDSSVLFMPLDWRFAPLRSDPRFDALLARIRRTSAPGTFDATRHSITALLHASR